MCDDKKGIYRLCIASLWYHGQAFPRSSIICPFLYSYFHAKTFCFFKAHVIIVSWNALLPFSPTPYPTPPPPIPSRFSLFMHTISVSICISFLGFSCLYSCHLRLANLTIVLLGKKKINFQKQSHFHVVLILFYLYVLFFFKFIFWFKGFKLCFIGN